jgi:thioredoxin 1
MSDTDDIEEIRAQKRERLRRQAGQEASESTDAGTGETPTEPVHVSSPAEFEDLTSEGVVLVDFHADWCGPCQMLEPTIEALARESAATVAKVDIDAQQAIAQQYGVRSVPTVLLFADGEAVQRIVGVRDRSAYESAIAQHV